MLQTGTLLRGIINLHKSMKGYIMTCNVGKTDRTIRVVVGAAAIAWGVMNGNIIADVVGGVLLFTAIIGWCPPYALLGINTGCKTKND